MHTFRIPPHRAALLVTGLAVSALAFASCASPDRVAEVRSGAAQQGAPTTTAPITTSSAAPEPAPASTTTAPVTTAVPVPTTTVAAGTDPSPVEGLTAAQLKAAVEAPVGSSARAASGPVADKVTVPGGATAWRVRVPGDFEVRSARVEVLVGGRVVGQGVVTADVSALVAVTTDGTGLRNGAAVSYQFEGGPTVAAGTLVVR